MATTIHTTSNEQREVLLHLQATIFTEGDHLAKATDPVVHAMEEGKQITASMVDQLTAKTDEVQALIEELVQLAKELHQTSLALAMLATRDFQTLIGDLPEEAEPIGFTDEEREAIAETELTFLVDLPEAEQEGARNYD